MIVGGRKKIQCVMVVVGNYNGVVGNNLGLLEEVFDCYVILSLVWGLFV